MDLEDGCLRGSNEDGWWLNIHIEKTLQEKSYIPVPHVVARAIEVLETISHDSWEHTERRLLFQWVNPVSAGDITRLVGFDPRYHLDNFAELVGVSLAGEEQSGTPAAWHWTPHRFRRFFAVLYFYRFEGASLEVLSHHLRHFNLEMTRRYVTQDKEVASIFTDAHWGFAGDLARSIVAGERAVGGGMGKLLKKTASRLLDLLRRKVRVVEPHNLTAILKLFMRRQGLVLTPKPWVICTCPLTADAARRAACRQQNPSKSDIRGPNFAAAEPLVCDKCPFALTRQSRDSFVSDEADHLRLAASTKQRAGTMFGVLEKARLLKIEVIGQKQSAGPAPLLTCRDIGE